MRRSGTAVLAVISGLLIGCDESPTGPSESPTASFTVDASDDLAWVFVDLSTDPAVVNVGDAASSTVWDLAFRKTEVKVNNGAGGPGDVATYCICQNVGATSADYQAMTAATELADFEAVTAADIPASAAAWNTGTTEAGVFGESKWYQYNLQGQHGIWPTFDVYLVRTGSEVFKVQITNYYGPAGETRQITFRSSKISG
jgi:HmuY protein